MRIQSVNLRIRAVNLSIKTANFLVAFHSQQVYNSITISFQNILINYCSTYILFCQERNKTMEDDDIIAEKEVALKALEECEDPKLIDLIFKLLILHRKE